MCNGCDQLASMYVLISQLTAAKHCLDMKLKNTQPGATAALDSIDISCLYSFNISFPRFIPPKSCEGHCQLLSGYGISRSSPQTHEGARRKDGRWGNPNNIQPHPREALSPSHTHHHKRRGTPAGGNPNTPFRDTILPLSGRFSNSLSLPSQIC